MTEATRSEGRLVARSLAIGLDQEGRWHEWVASMGEAYLATVLQERAGSQRLLALLTFKASLNGTEVRLPATFYGTNWMKLVQHTK
jgi:hypothetical protein